MPPSPREPLPRITPNVFYDDVAAALDWLARAFGFEPRMSLPAPDGGIMHAEMTSADGVIMFSPTGAAAEWRSPRSLGGAVTQSLYVYVDDVDAHCARARRAGAVIVAEPEDMFWGDRTYVAADPEGHRWTFAQALRDPAPRADDAPG